MMKTIRIYLQPKIALMGAISGLFGHIPAKEAAGSGCRFNLFIRAS
jgi:hypothetical protein